MIPYLDETGISDEDGVSVKLSNLSNLKSDTAVKIVVLRLRHISNFSDFDPLRFEPDAELIYSLRKEDLINADIIIIPGSKKTFEDLKLLRELKIDETMKELIKNEVEVIGICGGFQMLGEKLTDSDMVESLSGNLRDWVSYRLERFSIPKKITTQVEGYLCSEPSVKVRGYEIHKGISYGDMNLFKIRRKTTGETFADGVILQNVWGTYIHGVFESDSFRRWLINRHRVKRGLNPVYYTFSWEKLKNSFIDNLTETVERYLDMDKIWKIAGL